MVFTRSKSRKEMRIRAEEEPQRVHSPFEKQAVSFFIMSPKHKKISTHSHIF